MTRTFSPDPLPAEVLDRLLAGAGRAPSAGFSQGVDLIVLTSGPARSRFWEAASDARWRGAPEGSAGLMAAPVIVVPVADPAAYLERYAETDKSSSDLAGRPAADWPVPYWVVDAAFVVMQLLLGATDAELGALFFRLHRPPAEVLDALGAPPGRVAIGALALGWPGPGDRRTSPATRRRRGMDELVHLERW